MIDDPLTYLFSLEQFGVKFGIDNIRAIVSALGHPERAFRSVHVGGTNGKGSVTAFVDSALGVAGYRSGRYTSPHLVSLTERVVINGQAVTEEWLTAVVDTVRATIATLRARGDLDVHPTFFEVTTATAFELFRQAAVEVAVCEVGLGGRLDATNVLTPMVTAITSIGLDHEQCLGTTLEAIAIEKAGIAKPGVPLILGGVDAGSARAIAGVARDIGASVLHAREGVVVRRGASNADGSQTIDLATPSRDYGRLTLGLAGRHQVDNAVVAVRILELLNAAGLDVPPDAIAQGLASVRWRGRLERIRLHDGREVLLDAAHNPSGAATLAAYLAEQHLQRPLVFAAMRDKDARGMLDVLLPCASAFIATRATHPRSADPRALADLARSVAPALPVQATEDLRDALAAGWERHPQIVVAGSLFLIGDVLKELGRS